MRVLTCLSIEEVKLLFIVELAVGKYTEGYSVAICLRYNESIKFVRREIRRWLTEHNLRESIALQTGKYKQYYLFAEDEARFLIYNKACSAGINIHDTKGAYRRFQISGTTYSGINSVQIEGRVHDIQVAKVGFIKELVKQVPCLFRPDRGVKRRRCEI